MQSDESSGSTEPRGEGISVVPPGAGEPVVTPGPGGPGGPPPEAGGEVAKPPPVEFDSDKIGDNPYIPYLSIDTQSEHTEGTILIQDTDEIKSVLSQIQKIKVAAAVLQTINQTVKDAIGLIIP